MGGITLPEEELILFIGPENNLLLSKV